MAETIGMTIRRLRGNDSPADFAKRIGVHPRSVYKFETGERVPSAVVLCAIAEECGTDLARLVRLAAGRKPPRRAPRAKFRSTG